MYTALIAFIWYEGDEEEKNLNTLLDLLNESETREEDETYQNPVDMMFQELEERDPQHFAVRQYKKYKMAAGKTAKSILISCGARLAPFDIAELREIMSYDEMELDKIGDRKTALFLIMSDTDTTFNFVIAMLQSQLFNLLCDKADDKYGGRLPVHVRVIADKAEKLLYTALIAFIWYEGDEEEKNLNTLLDLLNESETREEDETYQNPVDMMFQELEERDPQHFAVRQYKKYKMAAGKTAKSILISCGARLAPFDIAELREIMSYDEMELDKIGDRKTALF